jgi:hypothetical protein
LILQDYRETFYTFSGKASDLSRQLAFAGLAIIWLFKRDNLAGLSIPRELLWPGVLIVLSLGLDMLHYVSASAIWRYFYRSQEKAGVDEDKLLTHEAYLEWPIYFFFCAKITIVLAAYVLLVNYFWSAILLR